MSNPNTPVRPSTSRRVGLALMMVVVMAGGSAAAVWAYESYFSYPKRFAEVIPNKLYRSGEVTPEELRRLRDEVGIETVVCLLNPDEPVTQREREAVEALGLRWINIGLRGNGASKPEDRAQILAALRDESNGKMLVHCAAGVNRTGLAVGLYRIHEQDWTVSQVLKEMKQFGFEDLPKHENLREALHEAERNATENRQPITDNQ